MRDEVVNVTKQFLTKTLCLQLRMRISVLLDPVDCIAPQSRPITAPAEPSFSGWSYYLDVITSWQVSLPVASS